MARKLPGRSPSSPEEENGLLLPWPAAASDILNSPPDNHGMVTVGEEME
jgi:hypothetical protein